MSKDKNAVNGVHDLDMPAGSIGEMLQAKMAGAEAQAGDELVVECDFSKVSRRWGREWSDLHTELMQWSAVLNGEARDDLSNEEVNQLMAGKADAAEKLNVLRDRREELMAQVIVDVPRSWLVDDAPDDIDWSDANNLIDYIKETHAGDLHQGVTAARGRAAKN